MTHYFIAAAFYLLFLFARGGFVAVPGRAAIRNFQDRIQQNNEISPALKEALDLFHYREAVGIIEKEKYSPALELLKAGCYKKLYALDSASAVLHRILRTDSTNVKAWAELGEISSMAGDYPESVRCYTRILAMDTLNIFFELQGGWYLPKVSSGHSFSAPFYSLPAGFYGPDRTSLFGKYSLYEAGNVPGRNRPAPKRDRAFAAA